MKRLAVILVFPILFILGNSTVFACTCLRDSVSDRFKRAKAVFIGQPVKTADMPDDDSLIQGDGDVVLQVVKAWKGVKKKFIAVSFEFEKAPGMCPTLFHFKEDLEYLVFAYGKRMKVKTVCPDTFEISDDPETRGYNIVQESLKELNNF